MPLSKSVSSQTFFFWTWDPASIAGFHFLGQDTTLDTWFCSSPQVISVHPKTPSLTLLSETSLSCLALNDCRLSLFQFLQWVTCVFSPFFSFQSYWDYPSILFFFKVIKNYNWLSLSIIYFSFHWVLLLFLPFPFCPFILFLLGYLDIDI